MEKKQSNITDKKSQIIKESEKGSRYDQNGEQQEEEVVGRQEDDAPVLDEDHSRYDMSEIKEKTTEQTRGANLADVQDNVNKSFAATEKMRP